MKWLMLACALVAMSWPAPVTAQPAGIDTLIVPGERIGPIRLGMDQDEVIRILGKPNYVQNMDEVGEYMHIYGPRNFLRGWLTVTYKRAIAPTVQSLLTGSLSGVFVTERGIRVGSPGPRVVQVYGPPDKEQCDTDSSGGCAAYYNSGILFVVPFSLGRVDRIIVTPPK